VSTAKLYLIPNTLGSDKPYDLMSRQIGERVKHIQDFIVENQKDARKLLRLFDFGVNQEDLKLFSINKRSDKAEYKSFLQACREGRDMGLISDAGVPGVADPGAEIVDLAHQEGIQVVPLVGPSSILLGLMASGLNGQCFSFRGYLPIDKSERKKEILRLERRSREENETILFIETPYRNDKMLEDLKAYLNSNTRLAVAADITLNTEYIKSMPVSNWKKEKPNLHKRPALFMFLAS
jgi:16S rRNA (cytidine1402-2'-O)-methyltransferase